MKLTLKLAAIYNILWGAWVVLFPNHFFLLVAMEPLNCNTPHYLDQNSLVVS
jgi:hypothetical protein